MAYSALFDIRELSLPGVLLITPKTFTDIRGYSMVIYNAEEFAKLGITADFKQDFKSYSVKGVIRGLHFQRAPHRQDKLVRPTQGEIFDVAVDYNPESPTCGTSVSVTLTAEEQTMLYIPGKYAHGFCVLSDTAVVEYKIAGVYSPEHASGVLWNDPLLNIAWPISTPILSEQDTSWQSLSHTDKV
ncbi:MAG: dTDP-4-dehydrorhamnose 3,5-epimerase [bacterium]|nr:dTDP-4-dehydrorhamnose 3,5-epimerase [bacterium]